MPVNLWIAYIIYMNRLMPNMYFIFIIFIMRILAALAAIVSTDYKMDLQGTDQYVAGILYGILKKDDLTQIE